MSQRGLGDYSFSTNERRDSEGLLYMGRPSCPHCKVLLCYKTSRSFFGGTQETWRPPKWFSGKESACQCRRCLFDPWVGKKIPGRRKWQPTLVFLPGESQGQRSLVGYTHTHTHTHARACIHSILKISDFGTTLLLPSQTMTVP